MTNVEISRILAKDVLSGKSKYVKDGILTFDCIQILQHCPGPVRIRFYFKGLFLASMKADGLLFPYSTFTFSLQEGNMKMEVADEDICKEPRESYQEKIDEICEAIRRL